MPVYEFIDADGARVTIRSARTLRQLLENGRIGETTRFRLAEGGDYKPAAEHPALIEIAAQAGLPFGGAALGAAADGDAEPQLEVPAVVPPAVQDQPTLGNAVAKRRGSVPQTAPAPAAIPVQPWVPLTKPAAGEAPRARGVAFLDQVFVVFASLLGAAVVAVLLGGMVGAAGKSAVAGWLVTVAAASWLARLAARRLAKRWPRLTNTRIGLASLAFLAGCSLAGWSGVIVGLPACAVLWTSFD